MIPPESGRRSPLSAEFRQDGYHADRASDLKPETRPSVISLALPSVCQQAGSTLTDITAPFLLSATWRVPAFQALILHRRIVILLPFFAESGRIFAAIQRGLQAIFCNLRCRLPTSGNWRQPVLSSVLARLLVCGPVQGFGSSGICTSARVIQLKW